MRAALVALFIATASCSSSSTSGEAADTDVASGEDTSASTDSSETDSNPADSTATGSDGASDADSYGAYPAGPYGSNEGDVLAGFTWEGYVNEAADAISNTKPYVTTSTDKLRRAGKGYGLIHVSEFI